MFVHERLDPGAYDRFRPLVPTNPAAFKNPDSNSMTTYSDGVRNQQSGSIPLLQSDSRARVPCRYIRRPGGCKKSSCPFFHSTQGKQIVSGNGERRELNEEEVSSH
jgi:hypothetical protein